MHPHAFESSQGMTAHKLAGATPRKAEASLYRILFYLLILSCSFDKAGIPISLGGRGIWLSVYKTLFILLLGVFVLDNLISRRRLRAQMDRRLFWAAASLVGIQTVASLCGLY